ncbi:MAG TPA: hypothetical protein DIW30_02850, partial [Bacteroidales bacterium]|nr:hypothetical protein [Bacteroidales bacterium]
PDNHPITTRCRYTEVLAKARGEVPLCFPRVDDNGRKRVNNSGITRHNPGKRKNAIEYIVKKQ